MIEGINVSMATARGSELMALPHTCLAADRTLLVLHLTAYGEGGLLDEVKRKWKSPSEWIYSSKMWVIVNISFSCS